MAANDTIVFLNLMKGTVNSIRGNGSEFQTLFTANTLCPDGIAFDATAYRKSKDVNDLTVWWSNMGAMKPMTGEKDGGDWHAGDGFLVKAPYNGGDASSERVVLKPAAQLVRGGTPYTPPTDAPIITTMKQIAITKDGKAVFFCDREGHCVKKYNVETQEVVPLLSTDALAAWEAGMPEAEAAAEVLEPNSAKDKYRMCVGIALDEMHNQIFFITKGASKGGQGRILAAPYHFNCRNLPSHAVATSSKAEGVIDPQTVVTLHHHLPEPIDLLLDAEEGFLYWTDRGADEAGGNSLNRSTVTFDPRSNRPQVGKVEILIRGFSEPIGLAWAASHGGEAKSGNLRQFMYVTAQEHLWRCDMAARTKEPIYDCGKGVLLTGVEVVPLE